MGVYSDDPALDAAMFDVFTSDGRVGRHFGGGRGNGGCLVIILMFAMFVGLGMIYRSCRDGHEHADHYIENAYPSSDMDYYSADSSEIDSIAYGAGESNASQASVVSSSTSSRYSSSHGYYGGYDYDDYDEDGYDEDGYDSDGYDRNGYDRDGYDRDGYDEEGYDDWGIDEDGYDEDGNYTNDW